MAKKKLSEWERQKNFIVDDGDPDKLLTEAEFDAIPDTLKHSVNHEQQTAALRAGGYDPERDRESMLAMARSVNGNLSEDKKG